MCFCILLTVLHNVMRHSEHSGNMPSESQRETPHRLKDMTLTQSTAAPLYEQTAARNNNCPTFTTFNSSQCAVQSVHWLQWWAHTHSNLTSNRLSYCPATAQLSASICKTNICPLNQVKRWPCRVLDSLSAGRLITVPNSTILVEFSREMQTSLRSITLCGVMEGKQTKLKH